ncbi:MAG: hypothetical protein LBB81_10070 [Treponema sp.]|jgi:hypothetical protein|nr:hypothetical protein [Treponema sp.]
MWEKKAITGELSKRYQKPGMKEKTRILNVQVDAAGYSRKYAPHFFQTGEKPLMKPKTRFTY